MAASGSGDERVRHTAAQSAGTPARPYVVPCRTLPATAVFSLPMIADRGVDMITACVSSVHAVLRNKRAALIWGGLIAALTTLGFATLLIGLVVIMPWLAYAAWHGYRATLDASSWPVLD